MVILDRFFFHLRPDLGGQRPLMTGGCCSEVDLAQFVDIAWAGFGVMVVEVVVGIQRWSLIQA